MSCYIFDIDGTLADITHRKHFIESTPKDWVAFKRECHADTPINHVVDLARTLFWAARDNSSGACMPHFDIVLVSGRNECQRVATEEWLREVACLPYDALYMRADGDYRADNIIKRELLTQLRDDGYEPIMAFDDRNQVVNMWRENGIPCAQVAEGNF